MAKINKTKKGLYTTIAYGGKGIDGNKLYQRFTAETKTEVEFEVAKYVMQCKEFIQLRVKPEDMTFQQAADRYLESKENVLSPSTIRGYKAMLKKDYPLMLKSKLKSLLMGDAIQRQMNQNAKIHSAKSLANQFGFISAVMRTYGCKICADDITLKPKEKHSIPVPTRKDAEKIISIIGQDSKIQCQVLLALTCSLRLSEIIDITVDDVSDSTIHVRGATVRGEKGLVHKDTNKSSAGRRDVEMPDFLSKLVNQRKEEVGEGKLFPLHPSTVLKHFEKLEERNGLPCYTIHSLRHCFAATMHAAGVADKYIMKLGGWSSLNVLQNIYEYAFEDEVKSQKLKVNLYFEKVNKKNQTTNQTTDL